MRLRFLPALSVLLIGITGFASQPDESAEKSVVASDVAEAPTEGILLIPDYTGELGERAWLLGDFDGARTDLANKGIQFNIEWTQTLQSVVDGGRDQTTEYGGSLDYNLTLDLQKMGIMPGALITARAESRYGDNVNLQSGTLLPVNVDGFFPLSEDDIGLTLTSFTFTQYLSPTFALFVGKVDTLDGDLNEFASGRGVTQFMNAAFNFNPVTALTVPYSTLAAGAIWLPDPNVQISTSILNATDSSTSSGFDDFGDGWLWSTEVRFQYRLGDLPGGQTVGLMLAGNADFRELGSRLVFVPGEGLTAPTSDESWFVSWNGWQYLTAEDPGDGPLNLQNRKPDLQGIGLFARAGVADKETNPIDWSVSVGIGGRGVIEGRDDDMFGFGYFYSHVQEDKLSGVTNFEDNVQGIEGFYNFAISPAASLTLDGQLIDDAFEGTDTAVILGLRLQLRF